MKIGIIVAMQKELDLLLSLFDSTEHTVTDGFDFHAGRIGRIDVVAMTCGIGKVNAALGASRMLDVHRPDVVVNSGVAGGTGQGAGILDVVLADRIAYHDVWCGPGTPWGEASGCKQYFTCPVDAYALAGRLGVKCGLVASGDIFVSRVEDVDRILSLYPDAQAVDMESAAIAQVCYRRAVPMYCLRVVSDTPGAADNIAQYENFWSDAPQHTFSALTRLIDIITSGQ